MTRLVLDEDVKPLSEFRANVTSCINQVRRTKRPVVITHHGKSAAVLLDVSEYEILMRKMDILEDLQLAEQEMARGKGMSGDAALKKIKLRS